MYVVLVSYFIFCLLELYSRFFFFENILHQMCWMRGDVGNVSAVTGPLQFPQVSGSVFWKCIFFDLVLNTSLENWFTAVHISSGSPAKSETVIRFIDDTSLSYLRLSFMSDQGWRFVVTGCVCVGKYVLIVTAKHFKFPLTTCWINILCKHHLQCFHHYSAGVSTHYMFHWQVLLYFHIPYPT